MPEVERALRDNEEMTEGVTLKVRIIGWQAGHRNKAPYHPDLLPSWEEFVSSQVNNQSSLKTFLSNLCLDTRLRFFGNPLFLRSLHLLYTRRSDDVDTLLPDPCLRIDGVAFTFRVDR